MHPLAIAAVLLAALTHATWNLAAKRAAGSRHFVWLYSLGSVVLYAPAVIWVLISERPQLETAHWVALLMTGVLHMGYSLTLQAGYRVSDLSLVYPLARGTGPLLSFFAATFLLNEPASALSVLGVLLIVGGILMVSGLTSEPHKAPRAGIALGILTGFFIAGYTINDGWAVKTLMLSPFLVDFTGNLLRLGVLAPMALRDRVNLIAEANKYRSPILIVAVLGPLGYILVLYAMKHAPIGHVAPMRELATLIGTYFGARLLREQVTPVRLTGAVLIVSGVVTLAATG
ncbi:EamA family transporter [Steroidobacter sp. S1-65]|uniref:EamA family transporter n=1 Tax=Steroidobacter gossypii TaxID=2805490 RepID=A0ABS1X289_9GAMM|nr:DMT family transporter [Steroidobacter gossypii]MBM0107336.1 EamA family transporter [Steroidobacter gossypii]